MSKITVHIYSCEWYPVYETCDSNFPDTYKVDIDSDVFDRIAKAFDEFEKCQKILYNKLKEFHPNEV